MTKLPLIRHQSSDDIFAYRDGRQTISAGRFLQDVASLAALLPARQYILNLCADRYHFAVVLSAALIRGQISLLPPNHTPDLIAKLSQRYPDLYCLTDTKNEHNSLDTVVYPDKNDNVVTSFTIPLIPAEQTIALVFTSGSTGEPLPHQKSWGGIVKSALAEADRLQIASYTGLSILGTVPSQHMYGLESTIMIAMQSGVAIFSGRPFYPADICNSLASLPRPRALITTPVHLRALLAGMDEIPRIDFLVCATALLSPQLAAEAENRFAAPLHEIYGCTEAGQVASREPVRTPVWRVFRDLFLRQDSTGTWVRGGHVEAEILLNDVIELSDSQTFLLHGRTADLVNIAGKRTSLANLNYHLNSIEGVLDGVFVVPEEEDKTIVRLTAFVVAPDMTQKTLIRALRQRIDAAFLPRRLHFISELPRNSTGKLPRTAIEKLLSTVE